MENDLIIIISGPDGAGKSYVIEKLMLKLESARHFHLFPKPHVLSAGLSSSRGDSFGPLLSFVKLLYLVVKFYFYLCSNIIGRTSCYFLFDRYVDEVLIDPGRFRINLGSWILKLVMRLIPSPDLRVLLHTKTEYVLKKGELSDKEIESFYTEYVKTFPEALIVDNDFKTDDSIEKIYNSITKK